MSAVMRWLGGSWVFVLCFFLNKRVFPVPTQIAIIEAGPSTRVAAAEVDALIESVSQLLSEASSKRSSRAPPPAPAGPPAGPPPAPATPPSAGTDNAAATENGGSKPLKPAKDAVDVDEAVASALKRVLEVVYFGEMFSGNGFRAAMERQAILSYEEFAEGPDAMPPPPRSILTTEDLDKLCSFADQLSTRPHDRAVSHKQALENCLESAMKLLGNLYYIQMIASRKRRGRGARNTIIPVFPLSLFSVCRLGTGGRSWAVFGRKGRRGCGGRGSHSGEDLSKPILHCGARDADYAGARPVSSHAPLRSSAGHQLHDRKQHSALELYRSQRSGEQWHRCPPSLHVRARAACGNGCASRHGAYAADDAKPADDARRRQGRCAADQFQPRAVRVQACPCRPSSVVVVE